MVSEDSVAVEELGYEPFGKRRFSDGTPDPNDTVEGIETDRGYTGHEHLDDFGLIHMNGRIYDPRIGRFLSADPVIQSPQALQTYNRYSYAINNPLAYTDPSGYIFGIGGSIKGELKQTSQTSGSGLVPCQISLASLRSPHGPSSTHRIPRRDPSCDGARQCPSSNLPQ
ncbi:MAG: RHS repeat-associated core domain-containing protein [Gammaproteobacteria bacterium]|nr:RHS repeat-associated core domain-containing protein [Gammaproteobacteria bacterium]